MAGANSNTISLIKKYNFPIQKKYGQNFLIDDNILHGIVNASGTGPDDIVLEIGPGLGAMTGLLCRRAAHVIAVEIDRLLIPVLNETLADYDNLTLINDDILKVNIEDAFGNAKEQVRNKNHLPDEVHQDGSDGVKKADSKKLKVAANLPYYITTPVIMQLLEKEKCIDSITVMVQKEVAQRMSEKPGSKSYGALSLAVEYYAKAQYVMTVSHNCFLPKPDVDSAVIRLDIYDPDERPVRVKDPERMFAVIRAAFNQRRKTLVNAVSNAPGLNISKDQVKQALSQMQLPDSIRGEALTLEEYAMLSELF